MNFEEISLTARGAQILSENVIGTAVKLLQSHHCPPGNEHSHGLQMWWGSKTDTHL